MASRGYMGANEVQALIGKWVDVVGHEHDRRHHHDHHPDWRQQQQQQQQQQQWPQQQWPQQQWPQQWPQQQWPHPWQQPQQPYYPQPHVIRHPNITVTPRSPFFGAQQHPGVQVLSRTGAEVPEGLGEFPFQARAAVVDAPLPTQANRDILPMSTGVPILPTQSAQITGRPQTLVFKIGRFVISNGGTAGGAADWIVNDIKIGNRSQFVQSGDVPGDMFATNAIDTFVRFEAAQTAMDVVVVVTYIGLNESGCPFFGAMVGTAAV